MLDHSHILFISNLEESIDEEELISFFLDRYEYDFFLESYLKLCEDREEYEICSEIIEMRNTLHIG